MDNFKDRFFSRRKWIGVAATASLGSGLMAITARAAESPHADDTAGHTLGVRTYNVRDFGAKGDGVALDTLAIQKAIDTCTSQQGGTVLVPAGVFVIGTIELKSNVTLHLAAGATLLGSADGKQYHAVDAIPLTGDHTLGDGNWALIFAVNAQNVLIEGMGTIDGQGAQFHPPTRGVLPPAGIGGNRRPYHLLFYRCRNLTVRDISLTASAYHSVRVIQCKYAKFDGLHIHNRVNGNNDGFHFVSSEHVHVSNCTVECQDDACALFGSCKFITVTNCSFSTRWSVFRFGGGEAENITVSNCLIYETFGCPIKMRCGPGSRFENISFSNLVMKNVTGPISIGLGPRPPQNQPAAQAGNGTAAAAASPEKPGIVRNVSFSGIHATVVVPYQLPDVPFQSGYNPGEIKSCMALNAMGEGFIENVSFSDVHVTFAGGGTAEDAAVRDLPKFAGEYYQAGVYPAYALFVRNVRGLTLSNVRFQVSSPEMRPAMVFDNVEDVSVNGFSAQANREAESLLRFIATRDVLLTAARVLTPAAAFLQVEGAASRGIVIDGGDLSKAEKPVTFSAGAMQTAVKVRV